MLSIIIYIIIVGSYIDRLNADFSTALHMAVMTGHVETIKLLVDKGQYLYLLSLI